jgi:hypothetical protein
MRHIPDYTIYALTFLAVILVTQYSANEKWESFSKQHKCKLTTKIETIWRFTPHEGFICDDGIVYYR